VLTESKLQEFCRVDLQYSSSTLKKHASRVRRFGVVEIAQKRLSAIIGWSRRFTSSLPSGGFATPSTQRLFKKLRIAPATHCFRLAGAAENERRIPMSQMKLILGTTREEGSLQN
jgi:hypothetical protein